MGTSAPPQRGRRVRASDSTDNPLSDDASAGADQVPVTGDVAGADAASRTYPPLGSVSADLRVISLDELHESPLNPRTRFDAQALSDLADSLRTTGQHEPLVVRPSTLPGQPGYEIASGHRRRRAAQLAGFSSLLALVRELSDPEFLEILTIANLQRENVHPLEEARGYAELIKSAGYDVAKIADRIGMSAHYVRDRLKLLSLIAPAQELFLAGTISDGHAKLISRLTVDDQERVLGDEEESPLFEGERAEAASGQADLDLDDARKPVSVRELESWINLHIRFDDSTTDIQTFFPETAAAVAAAEQQEEKIVKITYDHYIQPEARSEDERTFGPRSWQRADGLDGSKPCEYSVTGVIAIGPGRGEAFKVCTDKKRCEIHWKDEVKAARARAKAKAAGDAPRTSSAAAKAEAKEAAAAAKRDAEAKREQDAKALWDRCVPDIATAVAAKVKKAPAGANGDLADFILQSVIPYGGAGPAAKFLMRGNSAEDLVRYAAFVLLYRQLIAWNARITFPKLAKDLGVDVAKILKAKAAPPPAPAKGKKARRG